MKELSREGLGGLDAADPRYLAAWQQAGDLVDKEVVDVNGSTLGRVTRCFADEEGGSLARCDVTLSPQAKRLLGVERDVAGVPAGWIARVEEGRVRLRKPAEEILSLDASNDDGGARDLPRKNR